jgi:tetratricopeptide (TPR) repeat protein
MKNAPKLIERTFVLFCAVIFSSSGCGPRLPEATAEPKLPAAKPEAIDALKDAARLVRLGAANYDRALERLHAALELDPGLWEAWYDIGWISLEQHRAGDAAAALEKVLAILPSHVPSVQALGDAYVQLGRPADAATLYRLWLERRPNDPKGAPLRVALGGALRRAGKLDDAIEVLRTSLRQQPRSTAALNELGLVYQARGQLELADLVLHRALDVDEKSKAAAATWNNLGLVSLARRRDQEAFAHFDQAARLDPQLTVARRNKAIVYLDCGDYARAVEELKSVTRADDQDEEAWIALGVAERGRGKIEEAQRAYDHALEIDPEAPDALYDLGVLYMDFKKDPQRAYKRLTEFVKAAPASHGKRADAEARIKELAPKVAPPPQSPEKPTSGGPKS